MEREEALEMTIVMGLDQHRAQITVEWMAANGRSTHYIHEADLDTLGYKTVVVRSGTAGAP